MLQATTQTSIGVKQHWYDHDTKGKMDKDSSLFAYIKQTIPMDDVIAHLSVEAQHGHDDGQKDRVTLQEMYMSYELDSGVINVGKMIVFNGAMELYNITDVFNVQNVLYDPFDKEHRYGTWLAEYMHDFEESTFALIVKRGEQKQPSVTDKSVYNYLGYSYDGALQSHASNNHLSWFLHYQTTLSEPQVDLSVMVEEGFDSGRYLVFQYGKYFQSLYRVQKVMSHMTWVVDNTLWKFEGALVKVKDDVNAPDYAYGSLGFEHTRYGYLGKGDVGLISEYYYLSTGKALGFSLQNDLFIGLRLNFNDADGSELIGGVIRDFDQQKEDYTIEYQQRIFDTLKLQVDLRVVKTHPIAYKKVGLSLEYFF
jgi:hypothetical protein